MLLPLFAALSVWFSGSDGLIMRQENVRLFHTLDHPCGYFTGRSARNLVIDPTAPNLSAIYDLALQRGFRRAGGHVYRPHCQGCSACIACRVDSQRFAANRAQRRVRKINADVVSSFISASTEAEYFDLYRRYLRGRHPKGGMDDATQADFERFLLGRWSDTHFLCLRLQGELIAVAVTDVSPRGLSAVYTFYDPQLSARSLGTLAVLRQLELCQARDLQFLYLGYWIDGHRKMDYKRTFRPLEILRDGAWVDL